jgi:hypothetical protein
LGDVSHLTSVRGFLTIEKISVRFEFSPKRGNIMVRMLSFSALAVAALCGATFAITSANAQTPTPACGTETWSQAEMKYVGVPCAAPAPQSADGKTAPCGTETWSQAEMKYVGLPCTGASKTGGDGKTATCGTETWSQAEMKYVGLPCPHQ